MWSRENEWKKEGNESTFPASLLFSLLHRWANTGENVREKKSREKMDFIEFFVVQQFQKRKNSVLTLEIDDTKW